MANASAIGRWGRGSVWLVLIAVAVSACATRESMTGPRTENDPFEMFDRVSPPRAGQGAGLHVEGRITLQPTVALTKPTGKQKSRSELIDAQDGGQIFINNFPTLARLSVLPGSIDEDTVIDMAVLGSTGSIGIDFGPDGLTFSPSAVLDIVRPIGDYDPDNLQLYLTSADGTVDQLEVEVLVFGGWMRVRTWIGHFSGVGDEEDDGMNEEDDV